MNPLNNKTLWHSIGSTYVAIGFAVLAKRFAQESMRLYKEAIEELKESEISPHGKIFSKTRS